LALEPLERLSSGFGVEELVKLVYQYSTLHENQ
jgi:hypothetical protein